jgi:hypothetical protein
MAWAITVVGVAAIFWLQRIAHRFGHSDRVSETWVKNHRYRRDGRDHM